MHAFKIKYTAPILIINIIDYVYCIYFFRHIKISNPAIFTFNRYIKDQLYDVYTLTGNA